MESDRRPLPGAKSCAGLEQAEDTLRRKLARRSLRVGADGSFRFDPDLAYVSAAAADRSTRVLLGLRGQPRG